MVFVPHFSVLCHSPRGHEKRRPHRHIRDAGNYPYAARKRLFSERVCEREKQKHRDTNHDAPALSYFDA
jgi:hypothetical protein